MLAPWKENYDQPEVKWSEVAQSCPTLCDSVDCGPPGSSVHGILQGRILEWVTISFSRGSSRPRDWTCIGGRRFNLWLKSREVTGPYSQSCDFSSTHVWIWELDHKEGWAPKNWCFRTVGLEKTLENPLNCKEIKPISPKGNQPWILMEGLVLKMKLQYFGHLMGRTNSLEKTLMLRKIEGRRRRGRQRMRWLDDITNSINMSLSKPQKIVKDREAWHAAVHRVAKSWTRVSNWTTNKKFFSII